MLIRKTNEFDQNWIDDLAATSRDSFNDSIFEHSGQSSATNEIKLKRILFRFFLLIRTRIISTTPLLCPYNVFHKYGCIERAYFEKVSDFQKFALDNSVFSSAISTLFKN